MIADLDKKSRRKDDKGKEGWHSKYMTVRGCALSCASRLCAVIARARLSPVSAGGSLRQARRPRYLAVGEAVGSLLRWWIHRAAVQPTSISRGLVPGLTGYFRLCVLACGR